MKKLLAFLLALGCLGAILPALTEESALSDPYRNWYEIFVYSYQDSNGDGIGDINGLRSRLGYIHDMGYNGIWLMPIMPSPSYHKYDVMDYCAVDAQYGTLEDFRALVQECHSLDIRIIIDLPLNHTSTQHPWFLSAVQALRAGESDNPFVSYYNFSEKSGADQVRLDGTPWYYEEKFAGGGMPDLNLDNAAVREEIRSIMAFWLEEYDVDGFRLDAVTSYYSSNVPRNVEFLNFLKSTAESCKQGSFLVAEAWTGLGTIAEYYQSDIDCFFLFPASQAEGYIARATRGRTPASSYVKDLKMVYETLDGKLLAPFIGNHDTGRAVASLQARSMPARAKFGETLVNMMGGATFTYYGEEIGMVGSGDDPNKRLAMYWSDGDMTTQPPGVTQIEYAFPSVEEQLQDENSILNYCRELNHLKLRVPAIARGKTEFIYSDATLCVMKKTWNDEVCYIALNFSSIKAAQYRLDAENLELAGILNAVEEKADICVDATGALLTLPAFAAVVLTAK